MDVALRPVEHQRLDRAALGADAQQLGREGFVVGVEPRLHRMLLHVRCCAVHVCLWRLAPRGTFVRLRVRAAGCLIVGVDAERGVDLRQGLAVLDLAVFDLRDDLMAFPDHLGEREPRQVLGFAGATNVLAASDGLGASVLVGRRSLAFVAGDERAQRRKRVSEVAQGTQGGLAEADAAARFSLVSRCGTAGMFRRRRGDLRIGFALRHVSGFHFGCWIAEKFSALGWAYPRKRGPVVRG